MELQTSVGAFAPAEAMESVASGAAIDANYKRALDIVCASILLLMIVPVLLVVALLVKMSSPGPVIFKQKRIGRNGRVFTFYKFRTMLHGNDPAIHRDFYKQLVDGEAHPIAGSFKLVNDRRVTAVGHILRRYSLDELPQLANVLKGDMSLVGPRPPIPYEVELYGPRELRRLSVTPGLTGLWQVSGRGMLTFQEMIDLDLEYIANQSFSLDLMILLRTPGAILGAQGAG